MKSILVVDDNKLVLKMIKRALHSCGYDLYFAHNGKEGAIKALKLSPNLVLMDMHMPILNGYEATKKLRDQNYTGKIVAITAAIMDSDIDRTIKAGCDGYIGKPFTDDFKHIIKEYLEG